MFGVTCHLIHFRFLIKSNSLLSNRQNQKVFQKKFQELVLGKERPNSLVTGFETVGGELPLRTAIVQGLR